MAGTKAPLFGLGASGTLGGSIVFSNWRGRTYVRAHAVPSNPQTGLQVGMRSGMKYITQTWAARPAADKAAWDTLAAVDNITQLNAMVRSGQSLIRRNLGILFRPDSTPGTTPTITASLATSAQPKTLVLTWAQPVTTPGTYATYIYGSSTTGFTSDVSNLIAIVEHSVLTYTWIGLTTGVAKFWLVRQSTLGGVMGTISAQGTGTPT